MRGTTVRIAVAFLAVVLFSLQFSSLTASFASAHTTSRTLAEPGANPSAKAQRDEHANCQKSGTLGDPTGPLRVRDRHRTTDCAAESPDRPLPGPCAPAAPEPAAPHAAYDSTPRRPAAHSPAALQVFRC
ncbi:hypothetical protein ACIBAI_15340 [Streptomyces sp. NPDC051041]|uniref:Secreted protein n=1 Tax=Streptomyces glaucus TaxID=284029 RepID=A0ABP5WFL3_9ACTN